MNNYLNDNTARRYKAHVSMLGTTQLHLRNPIVVAWWSAAFPGFGHLLLSKYIRGYMLFIWEVIVNIKAHVNYAMIYSFQGNIDLAKEVLNTRWLLIYIPVFMFSIWDSYRTTVDLNKVFILANREKHPYNTFLINPLEINYLDKRSPFLAVLWSFSMPGLGQLFLHRILTAAFVVIWSAVFFYYSHLLEAISFLFTGHIAMATAVISPEWLLFIPSVWMFSIYDAYANTVFSTFEHSTYLELVVSSIIEEGIDQSKIFAVPLDNRVEARVIFDTIHRSDGLSVIDIAMALATAFAVVGASIGFILTWGPIYWGLIGAATGFILGLSIKFIYLKVKQKNKEMLRGKHSEVILIVECDEERSAFVEKILWEHLALGVAKIK